MHARTSRRVVTLLNCFAGLAGLLLLPTLARKILRMAL